MIMNLTGVNNFPHLEFLTFNDLLLFCDQTVLKPEVSRISPTQYMFPKYAGPPILHLFQYMRGLLTMQNSHSVI